MSLSLQCFCCKHYWAGIYCEAYPSGIPIEIFDGKINHQQPYEGDKGTQFEMDS